MHFMTESHEISTERVRTISHLFWDPRTVNLEYNCSGAGPISICQVVTMCFAQWPHSGFIEGRQRMWQPWH